MGTSDFVCNKTDSLNTRIQITLGAKSNRKLIGAHELRLLNTNDIDDITEAHADMVFLAVDEYVNKAVGKWVPFPNLGNGRYGND